MGRTPRAAVAALIRDRATEILPRVVLDAAAGATPESYTRDLQRSLSAYLERRVRPWVDALAAADAERRDAVRRLIETDAVAGGEIPPVVLLGTVAIGSASSNRRSAWPRTATE